MDGRLPDSALRFCGEVSERVAITLAGLLAGDRFVVQAAPAQDFGGVNVYPCCEPGAVSDPYWYFDNTMAGDDGYTDHLRSYFTAADGSVFDDPFPCDAPRVDADPAVIARWIAAVVEQGPPDCRPGP